jgi:hypothetical protein
MNKEKIEIGDIVWVSFCGHSLENLEVLYTPTQPFDSYLLKSEYGEIYAVQMYEYIKIIKKHFKPTQEGGQGE